MPETFSSAVSLNFNLGTPINKAYFMTCGKSIPLVRGFLEDEKPTKTSIFPFSNFLCILQVFHKRLS